MKRKPTFLEAISTIIVMVIVVTIGFVKFNIPIQVLLLIASTYAAFIAMRVGLKWKDLEEGITHRLTTAMPAIFIILAVGIIVGSWMYAGTVPALIYYGLKFLNPSYFLISAFIISAICSLATDSLGICIYSWDCLNIYWKSTWYKSRNGSRCNYCRCSIWR